ncbi:DNA polymerase III subunit delta' [Rhodovarius crocodyli]|uniref:DNA polymerase III subunit delta n=1 Tax=Rhodovarius crocodyli TaxID=1979269 RepID=A0A437ME44_9PROT|nr:DNA polymerase III subunit delta' [Rhodovarius crocodyli]RVT95943.1 DNA polymerase III subunit delta' [Rhodovarius crocodyli]
MTAPEPRENPLLLGHEGAEALMAGAAHAGRLHHAWLMTGAPGIGKATLAYRFARWLLAGAPAGESLHLPAEHPVFRRVAAAAHADLLTLAPNTGEGKRVMIRVEDVRGLKGFMSLTPAEGGWRVVVLDQPETMDAAGQNALLKTLEEPPPRAMLLLACAAPGRLLPTIMSRVRRLELSPLAPATMDSLLGGFLPDMPAEERAELIGLAGGSPGRALQLAAGEGLEMARLAREALEGVPPRRAAEIAERVAARDVGPMNTFFTLLRALLAGGTRAAGQGACPPWAARRSPGEWAELWSRLGAHAAAADRLALERKQAVMQALDWLR